MSEVNINLGISPEQLRNSRVAVIDGDSFAYIIGYNHKDDEDPYGVWAHVDEFLNTILQSVQARYTIGILNPKQSAIDTAVVRNFRADVAVTKPYKGNRGEKPEWYTKWAPVIEQRLIDKWGFKRVLPYLEADDVVATTMNYLNSIESCTPICCGCDKDLMQIPGHHYNYKRNEPLFRTMKDCLLDPNEKQPGLFTQILIGDSTDNIPGLDKCGKVGAEKILTAEGVDETNVHAAVLFAFTEKLGIDKGIQSFYENYMLCALRTDPTYLHGFNLKPYDLNGFAVSQMSSEEVEDIKFDPDLDMEGLFSVD